METMKQICQKAERKYLDFLHSILQKQVFFPLFISFSKLKTTEERSILKKWVEDHLKNEQKYGYKLKVEEKNTQKHGKVVYPTEIHFENEKQYLSFLSKEKELEWFQKNMALILSIFPNLKDWVLVKNNAFYLTNSEIEWENILKVCDFFVKNSNRNFYLRELPINVHTKFIEKNQTLLTALLLYLLPNEQINAEITYNESHSFSKRFGLKYPEQMIQVRTLDETQQTLNHTHFSLPLSQFEKLSATCQTVFIIENQITFLTFPCVANAIAIFGQGKAIAQLKAIAWLKAKKIYYWGDIDVEGFEILSIARANISLEIQSLFMNEDTYNAFCEYAETGADSVKECPRFLIEEEKKMFGKLKNIEKHKNRLEQENISQEYVLENLVK